jgi:hypothetical protein
MGSAAGTDACVIQGVPLAAGAEDEEDGIHGSAIIDAGSVTPERVRFAWGEQRLEALPQCVGYPPITPDFLLVVTHG